MMDQKVETNAAAQGDVSVAQRAEKRRKLRPFSRPCGNRVIARDRAIS